MRRLKQWYEIGFKKEWFILPISNEIGIKQTSAQITMHYKPETLIDKQVVGCINLGTRNIASFASEFLLVGFPDADGAICLITVDLKYLMVKKCFRDAVCG